MKRFLLFLTLIAVIGLAGYYYFQKQGGVQDIEFLQVEGLQFKRVTPFPKLSLTTSAKAALHNPNPFGVEITKMEFDVYVEDKHTTKVSQIVSVPMPAKSEFKLPFEFEIPLGKSGFFKDAKDVITGAWKNQSLKIKTVGVINIEVLNIPVELPFEEEDVYLLKDYILGGGE